MSNMNQVASDLYKALTESDERTPKPYDTKAEVLRIEGDTAWVKIPGGIDETPVSKTNNANVGDQVMVRLSGGKAFILGNETSPATDDTQANAATQLAEGASGLAEAASDAALKAQEGANTAWRYAENASESANQAQDSANDAKSRANDAYNYANLAQDSANTATYHLSEVEKVVDVLAWISEHGEYEATNDETIIEGKWYFEKIGDNYAVANPQSNPKLEGLYELSDVKTAVSNYIQTHLYLTNDGLYVRMDSDGGAQLQITGSGIYIKDDRGKIIAQYQSTIVLGDPEGTHIELSPNFGLGFYQSAKIEEGGVPINRVAYIQNDRLYIQNAILTTSLRIGDFIWVVNDKRISLKYSPI